jgi:DNA mismatch repair protein MutS2
MTDPKLRNGSMEYGFQTYKPTFRLILDVPGQSYGIELAQQTGLPSKIIERAKTLRGTGADSMEKAISELLIVRSQSEAAKKEYEQKLLEAELEKSRWEQEVSLLQEQRQKATERIAKRYEVEFDKQRSKVEEATMVLKQAAKQTGITSTGLAEKTTAQKALQDLKKAIPDTNTQIQLPGIEPNFADLGIGDKVYVIPLQKQGNILKTPENPKDFFDVLVGVLKVRASLNEIRLVQKLSSTKADEKKSALAGRLSQSKDKQSVPSEDRKIFQTALNTCNLRGLSVDDAIARSIKFIDTVIMRGESAAVLVHGHGTSAVKTSLRRELKDNCPYEISFRPGHPEEGGDAVTIVFIKD